MTTSPHELFPRLARARALDDKGDHAAALAEYRGLLEEAAGSGLASPSLLAAAAVAALQDGELEDAVRLAEAALSLDPLSLASHRVLDGAAMVAGRLLAEEGRDPADPATPRLYHLLVRAGRPDARSALALARFHDARGNHLVADALRDAVRVIACDVPPPGDRPFAAGAQPRRPRGTFPVPGLGQA